MTESKEAAMSYERRQDQSTASKINEVRQMRNAFGHDAALFLLKKLDIDQSTAEPAISSKYERRSAVRRTNPREITSNLPYHEQPRARDMPE
jgi:hypothetical protein